MFINYIVLSIFNKMPNALIDYHGLVIEHNALLSGARFSTTSAFGVFLYIALFTIDVTFTLADVAFATVACVVCGAKYAMLYKRWALNKVESRNESSTHQSGNDKPPPTYNIINPNNSTSATYSSILVSLASGAAALEFGFVCSSGAITMLTIACRVALTAADAAFAVLTGSALCAFFILCTNSIFVGKENLIRATENEHKIELDKFNSYWLRRVNHTNYLPLYSTLTTPAAAAPAAAAHTDPPSYSATALPQPQPPEYTNFEHEHEHEHEMGGGTS